MAKAVLILLTWPLGVCVSWMIVAEGFRQDPFALAVHEMLFIGVCIVLMWLSATFSSPRSTDLFAAIRHIAYYLALAVFSAVMISVLLLFPYSQNGIFDSRVVWLVGNTVLFLVIIFGMVQAFKAVRFSKASGP